MISYGICDAAMLQTVIRICEKDGRILDPYVGSGTTLVVADIEGYSWNGIEMTNHYY